MIEEFQELKTKEYRRLVVLIDLIRYSETRMYHLDLLLAASEPFSGVAQPGGSSFGPRFKNLSKFGTLTTCRHVSMNTPNNKPRTPRSELKVVRQKWQLHSLAGLEFGSIGFTWFRLKFMCLCWVTSWLCSEAVSPHSAVSIMQVDSAMHTTDVHIHET